MTATPPATPPVPYKSPMLNAQGFLTDPWSKWFRDLFNQIVGTTSVATSVDISTLRARVEALLTLATGPTGATGSTGAVGPPGAAGSPGPTGPLGSSVFLPGDDGEMGEQGPPGFQGPQGPTGSAGSSGSQGLSGITVFLPGEDATDGEIGPPGAQGGVGPQGTTGLTGSTGSQGPAGNDGQLGPTAFLPGEDGSDGQDGPMGPQGVQGVAGSNGSAGAQGLQGSIVYLPGDDGEAGEIGPPGPAGTGAPGTTGAQGPQGPQGWAMDGVDGDVGADGPPGLSVPGPQGVTGNTGADGPAIFLVGEEGPENAPMQPMGGPSNGVWKYLGAVSGSGVTVGPLTWFETYQFFFFAYIITGYSGGAVGRLLVGPSTGISTTAATNGNKLIEDVTANATSVSVPGMPLAVTVSNIPRSGWGHILGASGALKQIESVGMNGTVSPATSPLSIFSRGFFSDLSTNLPIKQAQLTVYANLTSTTPAATTFNAGTQLWFWGMASDPAN